MDNKKCQGLRIVNTKTVKRKKNGARKENAEN